MINFNVKDYVLKWLSPIRRTSDLLQFIYALVNPIHELWTEFVSWRTSQYYNLNITGQTYALQEHLNSKFDNTLRRINISHYNDLGFYVPLESEGYEPVAISLESEDWGEFIALEGEVYESIGVSFQVYIPLSLNVQLVIAELMKYKLAGRSFEVLTN
jgi:hypothetical protein